MARTEPDSRELRRHALAARRALSERQRTIASLSVCEHAFDVIEHRADTNIALYIPAADEVDTWPLIERALRSRKRIFVPFIEKKHRMSFAEYSTDHELVRNRYGLLQPDGAPKIASRELDYVFTPVVAFDKSGNRIGMGGGYYDRAFAFLRDRDRYRKPKLIGLAFDCQNVDQIYAKPWDIALFQVVTESGPKLAT